MATIIGTGTLTSLTVNGVPWLPQGAGATSQTAFEAALRAALAADQELNWLNGDVVLTAPIVIDVTANKANHGLRMHGARLRCDFNDATKYGITYRIPPPPAATGIVFKGPNLYDINCSAISPAAGAFKLEALTNASWIFGFTHKGLSGHGFSDACMFYHGSVFEFQIDDCVMTSSKHAYHFRNSGQILNDTGYVDGDVGIVSAVWIRGGTLRDMTDHPILVDASQLFREPRDFTVRDIYVVNNNGSIVMPNGFTLFDGVGFENNINAGVIASANGTMIACRAASHGGQPYLLQSYIPSGNSHCLYSCRVENEDPFTGMKMGTFTGAGKVKTIDCGPVTGFVMGGTTTFVSPME